MYSRVAIPPDKGLAACQGSFRNTGPGQGVAVRAGLSFGAMSKLAWCLVSALVLLALVLALSAAALGSGSQPALGARAATVRYPSNGKAASFFFSDCARRNAPDGRSNNLLPGGGPSALSHRASEPGLWVLLCTGTP
jgi:hypothetical protein